MNNKNIDSQIESILLLRALKVTDKHTLRINRTICPLTANIVVIFIVLSVNRPLN